MRDYRTQASLDASARVLRLCEEGRYVLGLGGGPRREHPRITNLNIAPYENVDIVGDAHALPMEDGTVDGVHSEAVFEHLERPEVAAAELFRVMKPGAIGYICTPFMQGFHAYPSHFQNFTHLGHANLFKRAGFVIEEQGVAVGPAWTLASVVAVFLSEYSPRLLRLPAKAIWRVIAGTCVRPLDRWLNQRPNAYVLASTTFVVIRKPDDA